MRVVLLDPSIAVPEWNSELATTGDGWLQLYEWSADRRVVIGAESRREVEAFYALNVAVEPLRWCPRPALSLLHEAFGRLLAMAPAPNGDEDPYAGFDPTYGGSESNSRALSIDIAAKPVSDEVYVAPAQVSWDSAIAEVSTCHDEPRRLRLLWSPSSPTREELTARRHVECAGKRCAVIGGQVDQKVVSALSAEFGFDPNDIDWHPSEPNKRPRDLESRLANYPANGDFIVVLTGKIGHSVSLGLKREFKNSDACYLECEASGAVVRTLSDALELRRSD